MNDKEAIQNLKDYIECLMEDYGYYKDIVEFRDSVEHLEKSLQTQKAEIENKDKQIEQYQNMLATNDMLHVLECEKKDKMINLMEDEINKILKDTFERFGLSAYLEKENITVREFIERKLENGN